MKELSKTIPDGKMVDGLYTISYAEHCKRMFKAYRREKILKALLIGSNALWLVWLVFSLVAG